MSMPAVTANNSHGLLGKSLDNVRCLDKSVATFPVEPLCLTQAAMAFKPHESYDIVVE